jgi:hypothetical protein
MKFLSLRDLRICIKAIDAEPAPLLVSQKDGQVSFVYHHHQRLEPSLLGQTHFLLLG